MGWWGRLTVGCCSPLEEVDAAVRSGETPIEQGNVLDCWLSDGTRVAARRTPAHG